MTPAEEALVVDALLDNKTFVEAMNSRSENRSHVRMLVEALAFGAIGRYPTADEFVAMWPAISAGRKVRGLT